MSFFRKRVFYNNAALYKRQKKICEMSRCLSEQNKMDRT